MKKSKRILLTLCLFIITGFLLWGTARKYYQSERRMCFENLKEYTAQIGNEIYDTYNNDYSYLESISNIFVRENLEDLESTKSLLASLKGTGMITRLELLLPDDQLLTDTGDMLDVSGKLSFEQEAGKGYHISRRCSDLLNPDSFILRHYVPIIQNGHTTAVLCGEIDLKNLSRIFTVTGYGDAMELYIVEGTTGNFLQDTWHDTLGSISSLGERQTKPGYSWKEFNEDITRGIPCTVAFRSETTGEYFYSYSTPVGVEDWMVTLTVPENVVFGQARSMLWTFYGLAAVILLLFTVYFIYIIVELRHEKAGGEKEIRNVRYVLEVEKELFDANIHPEHFLAALQIIAKFLTAEIAFCWLPGENPEDESRLWSNYGSEILKENDTQDAFWKSWQILNKAGGMLCYDLAALNHLPPQFAEILKKENIHNFMLIPVSDLNGTLNIILGAWNMEHHWENTEPLEQISLIFSMAVSHYTSYQTLVRMGKIDNLTGLMNRNSYRQAIDTFAADDDTTLACIYIDANGLHEINNHLGHQAGDAMLKAIAGVLKKNFLTSKIYRIGGDEFLVFAENQEKQELCRKIEQSRQELREQEYEVSFGMEWRNTDLQIKAIVDFAESAMQRDKLRYYQDNGKERQLRTLNSKVEQIMVEKQDADTFLTVLSSQFKGVYFVDLSKDTCRHLYIPSYFSTILEEVDDIFSKAILLYAKRIVMSKYCFEFIKFCDYSYLETQLNSNITPQFSYQRTDGSWVKLRVLKFKSYTKESRETLWIFSDEANI